MKDIIGFYRADILLESDNNAYAVESETVLDIVIPFLPTPKITIIQFVIKYINKYGKEVKITESLTQKESELVSNLIKKTGLN